jgi:predicted enzyme related to lactoylglutathione lyase
METITHRSEKLNRWYEEKLHLHRDDEGGFLEEHIEMQQGDRPRMVSFQVQKLAPLMSTLAESGVKIVDHIDETPRGRYAWFFDPEGNKVEIWEQWDESQSLIELPEPD